MSKRALLVGIDIYQSPGNNLNSCVADTQAFKALLQNSYGFDSDSIQLLHNRDATLTNLRSALDQLFAGSQVGDNIVFFQSSHGTRYMDGDTYVEALCVHDSEPGRFFNDTELSQRTQGMPPDVLTVVLDACHSGGMNKVFFPTGAAQVIRAKVWNPTVEEAEREAQLYAQVTKFKFFGRAATGDTAAVAKNMVFDPVGLPPSKGFGESAVDLNGAIFAACLADQTAAAGSAITNGLSAFTYGITQEADPSLSLSELSQRVAARLARINMAQTPFAAAPPLYPQLLAETFISLQPTRAVPGWPAGTPGAAAPPVDLAAWLREQLSGLG